MLETRIIQSQISYKKLTECISPSSPGVELGASKDCNLWNIVSTGMGKLTDFMAKCCKKYQLYKKMCYAKIV